MKQDVTITLPSARNGSAPGLTGWGRRLRELLAADPELQARFDAVRRFGAGIRSSEYHLTNACNIRCKGCWFFTYEFQKSAKENTSLADLKAFVAAETARGINAALLIGGEPTLFADRIAVYRDAMPYVTISTNGLKPLPRAGFEDITVAVSLFGGGPLDDELRAIRPNGKRFTDLFDTALENYRDDPRAGFIYALSEDGIDYIDDTVRRIRDNGNRVHFNFYSSYDSDDPLYAVRTRELLTEALRVRAAYPETVISHPYSIEVMITGRSHWGEFGYDVCPSVSSANAAHNARIRNGNPVLPMFNTWAADLETVHFCCTSGHCASCRDSQAVFSWLMVSPHRFTESAEQLWTWVQLAESYWSQFSWSPFHPSYQEGA
ncbi:radical SAM protein [Streptomyces chattanoogensis]|uniref:radical SAM protein n=1 Tax=Streptomyces chattanoogensis TaxID=66876 RepID=UPI00099DF95C|nr:radical SAM protein [Streptomyces chattanoogensis]